MFASRIPCPVFILFALIMIAALVPAVGQTAPANVPVASRILLPIDDAVRITIPKSTHPMAQPAYDVGRLDGGTTLQRIVMLLGGSSDQEWQARTFIDSQQTKGSPNYHHWLTPQQFGQKFGPSAQDIAQVTGWLQQHGFTIGSVAKSGMWLEFSGSSAQVETAFQTQMHQYLVNGELHVANANNISIPAALTPVVRGLLSLHNFYAKPMLQRSHTMGPRTANPNATDNAGDHFVTPGDLANIYDLNPLYSGTTTVGTINGTGHTIALVEVGNINQSDISAFQNVFGLTQTAPNVILDGPDPGLDTSGESSLDTEYSGAVAPGATIDVVVSGGTLTTDAVFLSAAFIVDENLADIVSASFGVCEQVITEFPFSFPEGNSGWSNLWEQAAAQGMSVFVSSGDTGAAGCDPNGGIVAASGGLGVNGFGSTPFNTAVGGTEFSADTPAAAATYWNATNTATFTSAIGYIPEMVWNDSCTPTTAGSFCAADNIFSLAAGSGGISTLYSVPSYQTLNIEGLTGAGFPLRPVPDVSLDASNEHDPYIFCFTPPGAAQDCTVSGGVPSFSNAAGGTSFSSPEFAGIMALVDQAVGGRQGLANQTLYALAASESSSFSTCNSSNRTKPGTPAPSACIFNDVTTGNSGVPGNDTLSGGAFVPPGDTSGQLGYDAVAGYDPAIGLGSVNASLLVNAWATLAKGFEGSTTTLTTNPTTVNVTHGQSISVSVSVARDSTTGTPSGNVSLLASGGNLPSNVGIAFEPLTPSGTAGTSTAGPVSINNLPGGTAYSLAASYPGDGAFAGSPSNAVTVTVTPENSTTALQSFVLDDQTGQVAVHATSVDYGDPVNILFIDADTAGVSGLIPASGTVTFTAAGFGSTTLPIDNSGIAELVDCETSCLTPGSYTITASYSGDALSYNGSSSGPLAVTVTKGNEVPVLTAPTGVIAGTPFTVQATIPVLSAAVSPTGTIQFLSGTTALGSTTLTNGSASAQVTLNSGGQQSITAQYSGDSNYNEETSAAATTVVDFSLTATSTSQTITAGQTATFNLTLNGVTGFSGQVSFNCTGASSGATCAVSPGSATLNATTTSVPVTVTVSNTSNARLAPHPLRSLPFVFAGLLGVVVAGLTKKPSRRLFLLMLLGAFLIVGLTSCGGGGSTPTPSPQSFTLTVTGTSGSVSSNITLNLTVN